MKTNVMKWYYQIRGEHVHIRVFMNGGKAGDLCFRAEEFDQILNELALSDFIQFIEDYQP